MSEKIAVVTDSTCDLSKETLEERGISFLPLNIIYKDSEYKDRVNISPQEVYEKFSEEIPSTSMPGPDEIKRKYLKLKESRCNHIQGYLFSKPKEKEELRDIIEKNYISKEKINF